MGAGVVREAAGSEMSVEFQETRPGIFEVRRDGELLGWLENAGRWTWLPDRPRVRFQDRVFGTDFDRAKAEVTRIVEP